MPPIVNIIAIASFAASLSARALDPVLPHIAEDFAVSIAAAAGFASTVSTTRWTATMAATIFTAASTASTCNAGTWNRMASRW